MSVVELAGAGVETPAAPENIQEALQDLVRGERWLRWSGDAVTFLSIVAFVASTLPFPEVPHNALLRIRPEQAAPALLGLLLLFHVYAVYGRRLIQLRRKQLTGGTYIRETETLAPFQEGAESAGIDHLTGLTTRPAVVSRLGQELARARREGQALSVLVADLDDFPQMNERYGDAAGDLVLREFARRLKKATRGCDLLARIGPGEFLAVLPECAVGGVERVVERLSPLVVKCSGTELSVKCSVGWVDQQHGELPEDLLKRAEMMLRLYKDADSDVGRSRESIIIN